VPEQITKEEYDKLVKTQEPTMENALETLTKITPAAMTKIYKDVLQEIRNNTTNS
jgi:hypothetical protein